MSKVASKTYGKKSIWKTEGSRAFDEAKQPVLQSDKNDRRIIRPSIWAKVPLHETLSPQRTKKLCPVASISPLKQDLTTNGDAPITGSKRTKKRKIVDPFGFDELDDMLTPAVEYISPKKPKPDGLNGSPLKSKKKTKDVNSKDDEGESKTEKKSSYNKKNNKSKMKNTIKTTTASPKKTLSKGKAKSPGKKRSEPAMQIKDTKSTKVKSPMKQGNSRQVKKQSVKAANNKQSPGTRKNSSPPMKGLGKKESPGKNAKFCEKDMKSSRKKTAIGTSNSRQTPVKNNSSRVNSKSSSEKRANDRISDRKLKSHTDSQKSNAKSPVAKALFSNTEEASKRKGSERQTGLLPDEPVVKRKRGRPPKKKPKIELDDNAEAAGNVDANKMEDNKSSQETCVHGLDEDTPPDNEIISIKSDTPLQCHDNISELQEDSSSCKDANSDECSSIIQDESLESKKQIDAKLSGSPFKWFLKNNKKMLSPRKVAQLRRISVLPTCTPQKDENDDDETETDSVPFGFSWAIKADENALRVNKEDKELFTIVRNTKQAQDSVEHGESQQFKDDVEYLLDGIGNANTISTRCLSILELAAKCSKTAFRMHLRLHGTISDIFQKLDDATSDQHLALCTSSLMFVLTRDRMSIDFDKSILELMLKLLAIEEGEETLNGKEWIRLTTKLKALLEKNDIPGVQNLDLSKLTSASLARESFLSLTLQRTGSWFKEEIRILGGLDHIVDTVISSSNCFIKMAHKLKIESFSNIRQIERCMKLLENVTVNCSTNQAYLIAYRESALLHSCARLLKYAIDYLSNQEEESNGEIEALWFSIMKILLTLTHDNEDACTKFCQQTDVLKVLLKSALQLPRYLPEEKQFDVIVLSLGLLINLVEYSKSNLAGLNAAVAPACYESSQDSNEARNEEEGYSAVESLMQLFLVRLEAAQDNTGMEVMSKLNDSLHNSSLRIGPDGRSLICGDDLEGTQKSSETSNLQSSNESASESNTSAEKEAERLGQAVQKAGKHMEDSLIASYSALLLGLLAEDSSDNQERMHEMLQNGDFQIMIHTLDKFLAFMNMTTTPSNASSSEVIKRAIKMLEECQHTYSKKANPDE